MKRLRTIVSVVLLAAAAVTVGAVIAARDNTDATPAIEPAVTKEVAVERGNISVSESVDGTVEETDTITVVHRIEGQTASTTANQTVATPAVTPAVTPTSAAPAGLVSPDFTASTTSSSPAFTADSDPTIVAVAFVTAAGPPADTTVPSTVPTDTVPPADTTIPSTVPTDTVPPAEPATAPTTTMPSVPGGGARSGGTQLGAPTAASAGGAGASVEPVTEMITGIAAVGQPISSGDVLYTVESRPVVALGGTLPAWRTMDNSSDDGTDIAQLEGALVALGYDPDGDVAVDNTWDSDTTAMVKRWQVGLGIDDSGAVTLGSVVFIPHSATVRSTDVVVGDEVSDGTTVLQLSGTVQQVIIEVPTELQADLTPSMRVDIAGTAGTITRLRSADGADGVTVQAVISPDAPLDVDVGSTVRVTISYDLATDQLVVPTDAVVSRLDGTYAVQTSDVSGAHTFATVEVVAVSGNRTAVTGDGLTESSVVFAPA